ncbi:UNVERIFIED_CONTAM: Dirigent protein 3 [Sesamum calycinum]|uniref:Dirigent protein n=1 Tax=Sesamum calycinum TaxID=2727403 RepID=A0AAW2SYN8_9LAMI
MSSSNGDFHDDLLESITVSRMEKTTHLHFYFQDVVSGKNPTAVKIIGDGYDFGTTFMIDDALTQGPERDSKVIGRAQGMYSAAAQNDMALLMIVTFAFTEGMYNGSSLSMLGRNHVVDDAREMPIVGGSGCSGLPGDMHWHTLSGLIPRPGMPLWNTMCPSYTSEKD